MTPPTPSAVYEPGMKTHRDENFPVARLFSKQHRAVVMSFYRFARAADDVADDPALTEHEKIAQLDEFEATLLGQSDAVPEAISLREDIAERGLSPRHGQDLLVAFRWDASKGRYSDWDDLMRYCAYSAMPVGRFVLDVHGEDRAAYAPSDALCAALQIINHLQDCANDYKRLDRIYLPLDTLKKYGASVEDLAAEKASPGLLQAIHELAEKTHVLLKDANLSRAVADYRLSMNVAAIQRLAGKLASLLTKRDPLSEKVHLGKPAFAGHLIAAMAGTTLRRLVIAPPKPQMQRAQQ